MRRVTPRCGWPVLAGILILLGVLPARATEPACPAGEITLSAHLLAITRAGAGADRLETASSSFVLPVGASIDPGSEPVSFVVEGDHRLLYQADIPSGGLVAHQGGTVFVFHTRPRGSGIGTGSRLVLRRRGAIFRLSAHFGRVDMPGLATAPQFAKLLVKIGDDCLSAVLACAARGSDLRCVPERSALLHGHVSTAARGRLPGTMLTAFDDSRLESVSVFAQENGRFVFPRLRPGTYRLRARLLGWQEVEVPVTLAGRKVTTQSFSLTPLADANEQLPASQFLSLVLRAATATRSPARASARTRASRSGARW